MDSNQGKDESKLAKDVAAVLEQVTSPPAQEQPLPPTPRRSVTVQDVIGGGSIKPPSEQEAETRILRSVEGIDPKEGEPEEDEETTRLLREIAAKDIATRASAVVPPATDPERTPLTKSINGGNDDKTKRTHRRVQTMEQRLFGLTTALAEMKTNDETKKDLLKSETTFSSDPLTTTANVLVGHARDEIEARKDDDVEAQKGEKKQTGADKNENSEGSADRLRKTQFSMLRSDFKGEVDSQFSVFNEFLVERKGTTISYLKRLFLFCIIPCIGVAALLFYVFDNPLLGDPKATDKSKYASVSWWLLFAGVRQPITLTLAFATQTLLIDFFILRTRALMKWIGPLGTLLFVQARGYPFVLVSWSLWDFGLLWGRRKFADAWLFWQDTIELFSTQNPSGNITNSYTYTLFIVLFLIVGVMVSVKRGT